jgi:hypothetical protein|tara:strand:+ start:889 stop:1098 length:210 start_codon:yes stop_codon:yes gene_type:complete
MNKIKDQALLKVQSKIWEQKRFIRELENDIEKDNLEFEEIELQLNNVLTQLEVYEYIKKAIQNYDSTRI